MSGLPKAIVDQTLTTFAPEVRATMGSPDRLLVVPNASQLPCEPLAP